jgi:hypothetical protein
MDKSLATVVFIAVAAEAPNKLLLKARQEAYELVTKQAKDLLEKQRKSYEDLGWLRNTKIAWKG